MIARCVCHFCTAVLQYVPDGDLRPVGPPLTIKDALLFEVKCGDTNLLSAVAALEVQP